VFKKRFFFLKSQIKIKAILTFLKEFFDVKPTIKNVTFFDKLQWKLFGAVLNWGIFYGSLECAGKSPQRARTRFSSLSIFSMSLLHFDFLFY
jgi:hypothetical protein